MREESPVARPSKPHPQPHPLPHLQQRFGISPGVIDRVVRVAGLPEVLEAARGVADQALVEAAQIRGRVPERVVAGEVAGCRLWWRGSSGFLLAVVVPSCGTLPDRCKPPPLSSII